MKSWSDSVLDSVNNWAQIVGIIALLVTLVSAWFVYATGRELSRRSSDREHAAVRGREETEGKLQETRTKLERLEAKTRRRVVTTEQRNRFVTAVKESPKGKVGIYYLASDPEPSELAGQI